MDEGASGIFAIEDEYGSFSSHITIMVMTEEQQKTVIDRKIRTLLISQRRQRAARLLQTFSNWPTEL